MRYVYVAKCIFALGAGPACSRVSAQTAAETNIYNFYVSPNGDHPTTGLMQASDGNYYGTANDQYGFGYGSVYRVTPSGVVSTFYSFTNGLDGGQPAASLIEGPDGALYGTTTQGGGYWDRGQRFDSRWMGSCIR